MLGFGTNLYCTAGFKKKSLRKDLVNAHIKVAYPHKLEPSLLNVSHYPYTLEIFAKIILCLA